MAQDECEGGNNGGQYGLSHHVGMLVFGLAMRFGSVAAKKAITWTSKKIRREMIRRRQKQRIDPYEQDLKREIKRPSC